MLVSGRPGPFRVEKILNWTAHGPAQNEPGRFRDGPRAARTILGHPESSLVRDQLGPRPTLLSLGRSIKDLFANTIREDIKVYGTFWEIRNDFITL